MSATEEQHATAQGVDGHAEQHVSESEEKEAFEYWGYLFQPDKTGTDKLKRLLRGLKDCMNERYERSEQPDLTPSQLAAFYRDLDGNLDQLFLHTPHESLSFIYKSLGCLHSLQPSAHATAFSDPTVPALKTEGWIMWQTIQLLLGPEEHSSFIRAAVNEWDVKDHDTGERFPRILPRRCFPPEPDKHMVAWYEGVSERLRREAEEESARKEITVHEEPETKRVHNRPHIQRDTPPDDDTASVDSRATALAYFRDPLYRHVDGRPSIVRVGGRRPGVSPRQTFVDKGKGAATTIGHIVKNVGSPHLWDGRGDRGSSRSESRDHRRRANPEGHRRHYSGEGPPSAGSYGSRVSSHDALGRHGRRRPSIPDRAGMSSADDEWERDDSSPVYSPPIQNAQRPQQSSRLSAHSRDQELRHSRSHEPTPTQRNDEGYFDGYTPGPTKANPSARRNSAAPSASSDTNMLPPGTGDAPNEQSEKPSPGFGPSFGPSMSPLFASHVAKQPQPFPPPRFSQGPSNSPLPMHSAPPDRRDEHYDRPDDHYNRRPDPYDNRRHDAYDDRRDEPIDRRRQPSARRSHGRLPSRSPARFDQDPRPNDRPPRRLHFEEPSPHRRPPSAGYDDDSRFARDEPFRDSRSHERERDRERDRLDMDRDQDRDRSRRRSQRMSGSEGGDYYSDDGRKSRGKQTRFADGVGGRRYPDTSPWRDGN